MDSEDERYSAVLGKRKFANQAQFTFGNSYEVHNLWYFLICDWRTSWTLLYKTIDEKERNDIDEVVEKCNASFIKNIKGRDVSVISKIRSIISIPSSSTIFCLDDRNLTKSCNVSILKQNATKSVGQDLQNLPENVFDQKSSNLCVAISVTALLKFAIKKDLGFLDDYDFYSTEKILSILTLIVYPRSMAGLNLNPNKKEEEFQTNEIVLLLERLCEKTYLMETGWQIIRKLDQDIKDQPEMSKCKYHEVFLNENFLFTRPLTVTGAYLLPDHTIFFHQMVLDHVDDITDEYVIQNSSFDHDGPVLRIPKTREYYVNEDVMLQNNTGPGEYKYYGSNGKFMWLVNEDFGNTMKQKTWYLLPQAFSITLIPE
ncbi:unnamed protein product [Oikopleura dioica]|uniref:Uncharacterized protein n=1 Tax=Oikopleura dioica TaxID=34765 RepID=E4XMA9_OIKDI|nr:unnamed protein product [Oikopleura dioica]